MEREGRQQLLIRVAKLYYESDWSQERIAQELEMSRPYISKLLNAAKQEGYVKIQVIDPFNVETVLEKEVREKYNLNKVIIVPKTDDGQPLAHVGKAAARFINDIIKDGDIISTSWGDTMYQTSRYLVERKDLKNVTYVQLCGGVSNVNAAVYSSEIANNFSSAMKCRSFLLQYPAVVGSKELCKMLSEDTNMIKIMKYAKKSQVSVFTIGAFGDRNALVREGYLSQDLMRQLSDKGAVGDICSHVINSRGEICDHELDSRTIAISLEDLRKKKYRIGVAQGMSKVESIRGALNSGILNVLITNEETAESIMETEDRGKK